MKVFLVLTPEHLLATTFDKGSADDELLVPCMSSFSRRPAVVDMSIVFTSMLYLLCISFFYFSIMLSVGCKQSPLAIKFMLSSKLEDLLSFLLTFFRFLIFTILVWFTYRSSCALAALLSCAIFNIFPRLYSVVRRDPNDCQSTVHKDFSSIPVAVC